MLCWNDRPGVVIGVFPAALWSGLAGEPVGGVVGVGHQRKGAGIAADVLDAGEPVGDVVIERRVDRVAAQPVLPVNLL
jgi:hypothetical protein